MAREEDDSLRGQLEEVKEEVSQIAMDMMQHRKVLEQLLEVRDQVSELLEHRDTFVQLLSLREGMEVVMNSAQVVSEMGDKATELELAVAGVSDSTARHGQAIRSLGEYQRKTETTLDAMVRAIKRLDRSRSKGRHSRKAGESLESPMQNPPSREASASQRRSPSAATAGGGGGREAAGGRHAAEPTATAVTREAAPLAAATAQTPRNGSQTHRDGRSTSRGGRPSSAAPTGRGGSTRPDDRDLYPEDRSGREVPRPVSAMGHYRSSGEESHPSSACTIGGPPPETARSARPSSAPGGGRAVPVDYDDDAAWTGPEWGDVPIAQNFPPQAEVRAPKWGSGNRPSSRERHGQPEFETRNYPDMRDLIQSGRRHHSAEPVQAQAGPEELGYCVKGVLARIDEALSRLDAGAASGTAKSMSSGSRSTAMTQPTGYGFEPPTRVRRDVDPWANGIPYSARSNIDRDHLTRSLLQKPRSGSRRTRRHA